MREAKEAKRQNEIGSRQHALAATAGRVPGCGREQQYAFGENRVPVQGDLPGQHGPSPLGARRLLGSGPFVVVLSALAAGRLVEQHAPPGSGQGLPVWMLPRPILTRGRPLDSLGRVQAGGWVGRRLSSGSAGGARQKRPEGAVERGALLVGGGRQALRLRGPAEDGEMSSVAGNRQTPGPDNWPSARRRCSRDCRIGARQQAGSAMPVEAVARELRTKSSLAASQGARSGVRERYGHAIELSMGEPGLGIDLGRGRGENAGDTEAMPARESSAHFSWEMGGG
eukprot:scaffold2015_cov92-Isochrysis_galbana.AAC.5